MNKAIELLQLLADVLWLWRHDDERPRTLNTISHPDTLVFRPWKPEPRLTWKEGTVITCPTCKTKIATARRDIYSSDQKSFDVWEWHIEATVGMILICPLDGSRYRRTYDNREHFHTERGWVG